MRGAGNGREACFSEQKLGHLFCLEGDSGKTLWQSEGRLAGYNSDCAALLNLGSVVMVLTSRGQLLIVAATGRGYEPIAHYQVSETATYAHPIFLGDRIVIKDSNSLKLLRMEE